MHPSALDASNINIILEGLRKYPPSSVFLTTHIMVWCLFKANAMEDYILQHTILVEILPKESRSPGIHCDLLSLGKISTKIVCSKVLSCRNSKFSDKLPQPSIYSRHAWYL